MGQVLSEKATTFPLGAKPSSPLARDPALLFRLSVLAHEKLEAPTKRLMADRRCSASVASIAKREFLRFIALHWLVDTSLSPSVAADEFWHAFIVHTKEYREFCHRHFGRFIDHEPRVESANTDTERSRVTDAVYESCFGAWPASAIDAQGRLLIPGSLSFRVQSLQPLLEQIVPSPPSRPGIRSQPMRNEIEAWKEWGDWNNSWRNWDQWKEWNNWREFDNCGS